MGLLKSTALEPVEGGFAPTCKGMTVNGVLLGQPIFINFDPVTVAWDDSRFPDGFIDANGNITPDDKPSP